MTELEQKRFRRGESTGRPLGGNISHEPFPQALHKLAISRGYESQGALARALNHKHITTIGEWYRGNHVPDPDSLGQLLVLLQPDDLELDSILNPYGELMQKVKEGGVMRMAKAHRKPGPSPFDKWVEKYCENNNITFAALAELLGFKHPNGIRIRNHQTIGLDRFSNVLQKALEALNLSVEETDVLAEAVATTIEEQIATDHRYKGRNHVLARRLQAEVTCTTYTPLQASRILGITRAGVGYLRNKFGLPILLTEAHLEMLKNR